MTVWFYLTIGGVGLLLAFLGLAINAPPSAAKGLTVGLILGVICYGIGAILLTMYIHGK